MLRWRLLSAAVLISIALALAWLDYKQVLGAPPGAWMIPLYLTILGLGTHEMLTLFANKGWHPVRWPVYVGVISLALGSCVHIWANIIWRVSELGLIKRLGLAEGFYDAVWLYYLSFFPKSFLSLLLMVLFFVEIRRFCSSDKHIIHVALSYLTVLYLGYFGSNFAYLRFLVLPENPNPELGMFALLSMIIIVKASDVGAYLIGRAFGRNKLAPKLSPGKTYEGAFGGLATAAIVSLLCFKYVAPQMVPNWKAGDPGTYVCYGILLGSVGIIGDLAESMLKREMGAKDSGNMLPGMGGVLDVLDSLLFAAPVAYVCWELGLLGQ